MNAASPYDPPASPVSDPPTALAAAEELRRAHIGHERRLKAMGVLYLLIGASLGAVWLTLVYGLLSSSTRPASATDVGMFAVLGVLLVAWLALGVGYVRLRPWVKVPTGILSGIGLLGFPVGTAFHAYLLWLVFSAKGKVILGPSYREVVQATPHVRYRSSPMQLVAVGLVLLLVVFVVIMLVLNKQS